jgi:hypothetical protein
VKTGRSLTTKSQQFAKNSPTLSFKIGFSLKIDKKQPQRPSEILPPLLCFHKELVLVTLRKGRPLGLEAELEMTDDPIDGLGIFDKGDDSHPSSTGRTKQRFRFVYLADHPGPEG